ncbi:MAG: fatty acid cis/trans isomerase, partial [Bdellovibrionales bacterium]|nr:fatty acid cis/trans isomerase [Bdellovibrionales bacterium]
MDTPHFFIESFTKGPVCRGQVALNVIEDHFWVFFVDPKKDISVVQPEFARRMVDYGRLPAEHKSEIKVLSIWTDYWQQQQEYMRAKESYMQQIHSKDENHALEHLLISKKTGLTVFRHSDSASVREGLWGDYP